RMQVLSADLLSQLLTAVASTVSQSSALLSSLDQKVVAAADAGSSLDMALVFQNAAQIASVQQTGMAAALMQLAAAAATGDIAVESLTAAFENSFTGNNLQSQVQSAVVDTSALSGMMSSAVNLTTAPQVGNGDDSGSGSGGSGSGGSGSGSGGNSDGGSSNSQKGKVAVVVGAAVGAVAGVALVALVG
ncbi:hypothetical protein Vafri_21725, partial [Volvox africanus]